MSLLVTHMQCWCMPHLPLPVTPCISLQDWPEVGIHKKKQRTSTTFKLTNPALNSRGVPSIDLQKYQPTI